MVNKVEYIKSNKAIRKFLSNLSRDDLQFFQDLVEDKNWARKIENQIRFKQICRRWTANMTIFEMISLKKAFTTLKNL